MPEFELRLDGHATGLACALATRLEGDEALDFAAFKMAHPLEVRASVILATKADDEDAMDDDASESASTNKPLDAARRACARGCEALAADLTSLLAQLPPDPHAKEKAWPERRAEAPYQVVLRPRCVEDEA